MTVIVRYDTDIVSDAEAQTLTFSDLRQRSFIPDKDGPADISFEKQLGGAKNPTIMPFGKDHARSAHFSHV